MRQTESSWETIMFKASIRQRKDIRRHPLIHKVGSISLHLFLQKDNLWAKRYEILLEKNKLNRHRQTVIYICPKNGTLPKRFPYELFFTTNVWNSNIKQFFLLQNLQNQHLTEQDATQGCGSSLTLNELHVNQPSSSYKVCPFFFKKS